MERPKPRQQCKECKKPLFDCDLKATSGIPAGVCSINCALKRQYGKSVMKLERKLHIHKPTGRQVSIGKDRVLSPVSKSQIKRLTIMGAFKKPVVDRDDFYRTFIGQLPCIVSGCKGYPIHAHHLEKAGIAIKGSDYSCVPLCQGHHTGGTQAIHNIGITEFEKLFGLDFVVEQVRLLRMYVRMLRHENKISLPNPSKG